MTTTQAELSDYTTGRTVPRPVVLVGQAAAVLKEDQPYQLVSVTVDSQRDLPTSFELVVDDPAGVLVTEEKLDLGARVEIRGPSIEDESTVWLCTGEVTALEGIYESGALLTVVRGYSPDHRLQRVRRAQVFVDVTDTDIAKQLAGGCKLTLGTVEASGVKHPWLGQANQTDWGFLAARAREIGFELGTEEKGFFFRRSGQARGPAVEVSLGEQLLRFSPRISAASLPDETEVRVWDPVNAKAVAVVEPTEAAAVRLDDGPTAGKAAAVFAPRGAAPPATGSGETGPPPSAKAVLVTRRQVAVCAGTDALTQIGQAAAARAGRAFAEAEGLLLGDPRVAAGVTLSITGVPHPFAGSWTVTGARHQFSPGGYHTYVRMTARQNGALFASTDEPRAADAAGGAGPVCGVVTDIADPLKLGRVKVALPVLAPDFVTDWAPVTQLGAGKAGGAVFLPEPNEQVLVAFEHGDLRRPYVLGSVINERTGAGGLLGPGGKPGDTAVKSGKPASVVRRGVRTPSGSGLVFHDEVPPSGGTPTAAEIILGTEKEKIALVMDGVKKTLTMSCKPGSGTLTIECDGNVEIKAGPSGKLAIDGGTRLTLKGKVVEIRGDTVKVESTGPMAVKGKPVQLN